MKPPATPVRPTPARPRLLAAAARVFARDGLRGATTRAIAREAGVNEVTLFRLFQSKERLLDAVVGQNFGSPAPHIRPSLPRPTGDLRRDLTAHARSYDQLLQANLPLIRAMIGEIHHHGDHERQVFKAIFRPMREALIARLEAAVTACTLPRGVNPVILADLFNGMVFTGVLRRTSAFVKREYPTADYRTAAVELLLGAATASSQR